MLYSKTHWDVVATATKSSQNYGGGKKLKAGHSRICKVFQCVPVLLANTRLQYVLITEKTTLLGDKTPSKILKGIGLKEVSKVL